MQDGRCTAILLAAGKGTRMGGDLPKQYMDLCGKPLIAWTLRALAASPVITEIVMVIPKGDEDYVKEHVINALPEKERALALEKLRSFAPGGAERYLSVLHGIRAITWPCDYLFIHDGARPFIDEASIERLYQAVQDPENGGTAVAGMPTKDTVKITDAASFVESTPDRNLVWIIQTPQVFSYTLIKTAYERMADQLEELRAQGVNITDDAMLVEHLMKQRVKLVPASYRNIKVTTPEDLLIAEVFLRG